MFDIILSFFQTSFAWTTAIAAIILFVMSYFSKLVFPYGIIFRPASALLFCVSFFVFGVLHEKENTKLMQDKYIAQIKELENKTKTIQVVTEYKDRIKVVKEKGDTIYEQVPIYINQESDSKCVLPNGFVSMHDAAAQNTISGTPGGVNEDPSGIKLSEATKTIVLNYQYYHELVTQLTSLQKWIREMQALHN